MSWPAVLNTKRRRVFALFALAEISLIMSVPFLAIAGAQSILGSRAGAFVQQVGPDDAGWFAQVDPTSVAVFVTQYEGQTVGAVLAAHEQGVEGGAIVLFSADTVMGTATLGQVAASEVPARLASALKLRIDESAVVSEADWQRILGANSYQIDNSDRFEAAPGVAFESGKITVSGDNAASFLASSSPGSGVGSSLERQELFWRELVAKPPTSDDPVARKLQGISGGTIDLFQFSAEAGAVKPSVDETAAVEELVRRVVPFPAGNRPEDRVRLRIVDRTGSQNLLSIAAQLAAKGVEVVEVANADKFENGPTELFVPSQWEGPDTGELKKWTAAKVVSQDVSEPESVATLLVGADFSIVSA